MINESKINFWSGWYTRDYCSGLTVNFRKVQQYLQMQHHHVINWPIISVCSCIVHTTKQKWLAKKSRDDIAFPNIVANFLKLTVWHLLLLYSTSHNYWNRFFPLLYGNIYMEAIVDWSKSGSGSYFNNYDWYCSSISFIHVQRIICSPQYH